MEIMKCCLYIYKDAANLAFDIIFIDKDLRIVDIREIPTLYTI
jgi:uncharacterized membrane protein (UPF0127 family)